MKSALEREIEQRPPLSVLITSQPFFAHREKLLGGGGIASYSLQQRRIGIRAVEDVGIVPECCRPHDEARDGEKNWGGFHVYS